MDALEVEPLSRRGRARLCSRPWSKSWGSGRAPASGVHCFRAAAGFPLAMELMLRDWQVHGVRSTAFAVQAITSEVQAHPEARYQQLTESLLADLGDTERLVVHMAAVLDRRVGDLKLYQIAGLPRRLRWRPSRG